MHHPADAKSLVHTHEMRWVWWTPKKEDRIGDHHEMNRVITEQDLVILKPKNGCGKSVKIFFFFCV